MVGAGQPGLHGVDYMNRTQFCIGCWIRAAARRVLALLLAAGMTYALSQTLILPALPALVRELGASPLAVSWLLTAYLVAASVATPLIGRLGDLFGRGRVLTWVMAIFCAGSIVCALGQSLPLLVAGRILQGVAGGVFPFAYGIIRDTFPPAARMRAIGTLSVSLGVGAALGPAIAGVIVDRAGPSAIFWVGMIGAIPALAAARLVPERPAGPRARVDWLGAVALAGALTALLVLMTQGRGSAGHGTSSLLRLHCRKSCAQASESTRGIRILAGRELPQVETPMA